MSTEKTPLYSLPSLTTYTGKQIFPLQIVAEEIDIEDIAHALSMTCRYNGHVKRFYSVAEHCVLMVKSEFPGMLEWKLLHDAAEAYLPDVCCGFKPLLPKLVEGEKHILRMIAEKYDLPPFVGEVEARIKLGDRAIRYWEGRALMPDKPNTEWSSLVTPPKVKIKIECWPPEQAERIFLDYYYELFED